MFSHPGNRLFFRTTVINLVYLSVILPVFPDEVDDTCVPSGKSADFPDGELSSAHLVRKNEGFPGQGHDDGNKSSKMELKSE